MEGNDYFGEFDSIEEAVEIMTHNSRIGNNYKNFRVFKGEELEVEPDEPEVIQSYIITEK